MGRIVSEGITFDDVLLVPSYSEVIPNAVDLSTNLTRSIRLNIPVRDSLRMCILKRSSKIFSKPEHIFFHADVHSLRLLKCHQHRRKGRYIIA